MKGEENFSIATEMKLVQNKVFMSTRVRMCSSFTPIQSQSLSQLDSAHSLILIVFPFQIFLL